MATKDSPRDGLDHQFHGTFQRQKLTAAMSNSNPAAPEHGGAEAFSGQSKQLYTRRSNRQSDLQKEISGLEKEYDKTIREVHKTRCDISDESKAARRCVKTRGVMKSAIDHNGLVSVNPSGQNRNKLNESKTDNSLVNQKFISDVGLNREKFTDHKRKKAVDRLRRISRYRSTSPDSPPPSPRKGAASEDGTTASSSYAGLNTPNRKKNTRKGKEAPAGKNHVFNRLSADSSFYAMPSDIFLKQCHRKSIKTQKNRATSYRGDFKF